MSEPAVALAFTPDFWVEDLHRHLSDHGGARVRSLVVEPGVAIEETYDVLVVGHRWPPLTQGLVGDVHARGRAVLGVFDREEAASRAHLVGVGVDAVIESDAGPEGFVRAIVAVTGRRADGAVAHAVPATERAGRLVTVGGAPGAGRTEIAIQLALALGRRVPTALADADDVAPAVAQRLQLPIEPNISTAIEAAEHGRGTVEQCLAAIGSVRVLPGVPNARAWAQVRPGEVVRVIDRLASDPGVVVVADGAGPLDDLAGSGARTRYATARALVSEADALVVVGDGAPHGVTRMLSWCVEARSLAPETPMIVVVNRAPGARFQRGELYEELRRSVPVVDVVFVPHDARVVAAAWAGMPAGKGGFVRAVERLAELVAALPRLRVEATVLEVAS